MKSATTLINIFLVLIIFSPLIYVFTECYNGIGRKVFQSDTQGSFYAQKKNKIAEIVKKGGIVICFGWNSMGIGKTRGFEMIEILLVPHGGSKNDTIVTVERKVG
jgi:hypothetical protein